MKTSSIITRSPKSPPPGEVELDRPLSILVVDDEENIREVLASALERSGYETDSADDGIEGWNKLHTASYSLLITDNNMPRMSGVELIGKIRAARMDLPIILATSDPPRNLRSLQLAGILRKPFSLQSLRQTVDDALQYKVPAGASPSLKQLARQLMDHETVAETSPITVDIAAFAVFEKLRGPFTRLTGTGGYHALLSRAQALAGDEIHWLVTLRIEVDGSLAGPDGLPQDHDANTVHEGEVVLLAQLLGLLDTLIGSALMQRLLRDIWPGLEELDS